MLKNYEIPGASIALVHKGKLVWSAAYGYADIKDNRKMTLDAVYRVESISKSVTAWGVMKLVEEGLIDLDVPVQQYLVNWKLPEFKFSEKKVTVRRLLSNSAGLTLGTIGEEYYPTSDMPTLQDYLKHEVNIIQEPGSGFIYSNVGYNMLEMLIEEVSGRDFAEYMAAEVLYPLGMQNSSFSWHENFHSEIPTGYDLHGHPVQPYVYPVRASGGLFAVVEDVARFVCVEMTGSYYSDHAVLQPETIRLIHSPEVTIPGIFGVVADSYGFGHFIENLSNGQQAVWHGGQGHGWMTHLHVVPESGEGIVILTNSQRSWPFISVVLDKWSQWCDISSVKMSRISDADFVFKVLIGTVLFVSLLQMYRLLSGLRSGIRRFNLLTEAPRILRLSQAVFGISMIVALWWSAVQPYLFISSIFPDTANVAGISLLILAIILILSAMLPQIKD